MNKLVKRIIGATSACALVLGMVLGANALAKKGEVKEIKEQNEETMVTFHYEAPSTDPYTHASVSNTANWKEEPSECTNPGDDAPCSIQVPESKTQGTPGVNATIDSTLVTINTSPITSSQHIVAPSSSSQYTNVVNRTIP